MKKAVFMLALSLVALAPRKSAFAKPILRHVEGLHGIEANAGITAIGKACAIDWSYYFTPCWQIKAGLGAEINQFQDNAYRNIFTQPVVAHTLFTNYNNVFLNVVGGASLHLESYWHKKQQKSNNNFNIGIVLGGELELFLVRHWAALLSGGSRIFFLNSPCGKMDYFLSFGMRITF